MYKVLVGTEPFLIRMALNRELAGKSDVSYHDELTAEVLEAGRQMSLFGDSRTIVLRLKEIGADEELLRLLKKPAPYCDYIITAESIDKRTSVYRFLKGKPELLFFNKVGEDDFRRYVLAYMKKKGMQIRESAYRLLIQRSDYFSSEQVSLDTIFLYLKQMGFLSKDITEQEVLQVVPEVEGGKVFDLSKILFSGRKTELFSFAERLLDGGENPIGMMSLLLRNFRIGLKASMLADQKSTAISREIGVPAYQFEELITFKPEVLEQGIHALQEGINGIKSGKGSPRVVFMYTLGRLEMLLNN